MPKPLISQRKNNIGCGQKFRKLSIGYKDKQEQKQSHSSNTNDLLKNWCKMESCHDNAAINKPSMHLLGSKAFPKQLMTILSKKGYEEIISWMPDGKSFLVYDKNELNKILSSCYFQSTKYDSFRRKLHRWGFRITKKGVNAGAYYHELFLRDDPSLCSKMKCAKKDRNTKISTENNEMENNNNIFEEYVMAMHVNYWSRRPRLLECFIYLQQHGAFNYLENVNQSSNELENKTKEEDVSNRAKKSNNENKAITKVPNIRTDDRKTNAPGLISNYCYYKSLEGSTKAFPKCDQSAKPNSNKAFAA